MTKKDYMLLASVMVSARQDFNVVIGQYTTIATLDNEAGNFILWSLIVSRMADALARDNGCFNRTKFIDACKGAGK